MTESPVGRTKDAGWQIGVSRTVHADIDEVWDYLVSPEGLSAWLGPGVATPLEVGQQYRTDDDIRGEIRSLRSRDRVRLTWQPPGRRGHATIQIALTPTKTGCTMRFHTERLVDADEREQMRSHWKRIADAIEETLSAST
jgi:uncharacterized protein YndB with AHSA1/START domain